MPKSAFLYDESGLFLEQELKNFSAAAVTSPEGESLFVKALSPADLGSLGAAAQVSYKYFQIKPGEVVLMNDPYSGGSILSTMTLITGIRVGAGGGKRQENSDLLLVARLPFKPRVRLVESVDAEGLRIPPTPIAKDGKLNRDLLTVIAQHPECPPRFDELLTQEIQRLNSTAARLGRGLMRIGFDASKKCLKDFFAKSLSLAKQALGELAVGEAKEDLSLDDGSKVCLRLEVSEGQLLCDFTGTTASRRYHLTDSSTMGVCAAATYAYLNARVPYNSGTLDPIHIVAPAGSMVNARYPSPVFLGLTDGAEIIASMMIRLLSRIDSHHPVAQSGISQCAFHVEFGQDHYYYDFLVPGGGAGAGRTGPSGVEIWKRTPFKPSVEEVERRYPILMKTAAYRQKSGGSGLFAGGEGVTKVFEVNAPARLKWCMTEVFRKPEGLKGGKSAMGPEIQVVSAGVTNKVKLGEQGDIELKSGDQVVVHSAGGGGFGDPEKPASS